MNAQTEEDIYFMKMAQEEALLAYKAGEVPVGAIVVRDGQVLARAHNLREASCDPSAHAEILALRASTETSDTWRLSGTTIYVTLEPCVMCSGALINARVSRLVYGCRDAKAGGVDSLYSLLSDIRLNHQVTVTAGVLEEDCAALLRQFFRERR
ncbi:MAG: tRNA-specific adenosine deaminase [Thermodesulfovibrio sp.]|nr:tRNA-specific adenosine deaminase [Thermodesulfovibrio sp.]